MYGIGTASHAVPQAWRGGLLETAAGHWCHHGDPRRTAAGREPMLTPFGQRSIACTTDRRGSPWRHQIWTR